MNVLNLYCSCTGNTRKVAVEIETAALARQHTVTTFDVQGGSDEQACEFLDYDFVFIGSGVYAWLPPKPMMSFLEQQNKKHSSRGDIKMCSPRIPNKKAVAYCTYGGPHTGLNEGVIVPKYLGQLLDHLGFEIVAEWHFVAGFHSKELERFSRGGRLGDISGRPNEEDLKRIRSLVDGILNI